ncbi:MAG: FAD-binding oxidoreductase [Methylacidiphilales bacterium]|nr:FAD-binding oxidoreductase [Candidatus Methylacidiphilales bacterium]
MHAHQNNYYFQHQKAEFSQLTTKEVATVGIIGGGLSGINTAIELRGRGINVAVLESRHIGWGASGRNGGQLIRGYSFNPDKFKNSLGAQAVKRFKELGIASVGLVKDRIKQYNIDCDFEAGYCSLATNQKQWDWCRAEYENNLSEQKDFTLYEKDRLFNEVIASDMYCGGLVDSQGGHLHPFKLTTGEAIIAQSLGAAIYQNSEVIKIKKSNSQFLLITSKGQLLCDIVVYCCNAYINKLNLSLDSRAISAGSYIVATKALDSSLIKNTIRKNYAFCDLNTVLDYFRLSKDNRLLYGGRCNYSGIETRNIEKYLRPRMEQTFPLLTNYPVEFQWGGRISIGFNRVPQIGRFNPQVYYAFGYSGHGLNNTHLAGKLIADKIVGESADFDLFNSVWHMKFPPFDFIRGPLTSLVMMGMRIKDKYC